MELNELESQAVKDTYANKKESDQWCIRSSHCSNPSGLCSMFINDIPTEKSNINQHELYAGPSMCNINFAGNNACFLSRDRILRLCHILQDSIFALLITLHAGMLHACKMIVCKRGCTNMHTTCFTICFGDWKII